MTRRSLLLPVPVVLGQKLFAFPSSSWVAAQNTTGDIQAAEDGTILLLDRRAIAHQERLKMLIAPTLSVRGPLTIDGRNVWTKANVHAIVHRGRHTGEYTGWWLDMRPTPKVFDARWLIPMRSDDGEKWTTTGEAMRMTGTILKDDHDGDDRRRYKILYQGWGELNSGGELIRTTDVGGWSEEGGADNTRLKRGIFVATSPDGRSWGDHHVVVMQQLPLGERNWKPYAPGWAGGDNFPCLIYAPDQQKWVAFYRTNITNGAGKRRERAVGRSDSSDFRAWGPHQMALYARTEALAELGYPKRDFYQLQVWRWAGVYLGALSVFYWGEDRVRLELAWSPDTITWEQLCPGTDLVPHGPLTKTGGGCRFAAHGVLSVGSTMRLYFGEDNGRHNADSKVRQGSLYYAVFGRHRWAGYRAEGEASGQLTTKPFRLGARPPVINLDASAGQVKAELQGEDGHPLPGFELARSQVPRQDALNAPLGWNRPRPFETLQGQLARIHLELRGRATVYSLKI